MVAPTGDMRRLDATRSHRSMVSVGVRALRTPGGSASYSFYPKCQLAQRCVDEFLTESEGRKRFINKSARSLEEFGGSRGTTLGRPV
jgi:hypothetical protein